MRGRGSLTHKMESLFLHFSGGGAARFLVLMSGRSRNPVGALYAFSWSCFPIRPGMISPWRACTWSFPIFVSTVWCEPCRLILQQTHEPPFHSPSRCRPPQRIIACLLSLVGMGREHTTGWQGRDTGERCRADQLPPTYCGQLMIMHNW